MTTCSKAQVGMGGKPPTGASAAQKAWGVGTGGSDSASGRAKAGRENRSTRSRASLGAPILVQE